LPHATQRDSCNEHLRLDITAIGERAQHRDRFANLGSLHPVETYRIFKRALAQAKAGKTMFSICIERKFVVK